MKKITNILLGLCLLVQVSFAQKNPESTELWEPVPARVTPGEPGLPPSDAIILFMGEDLLSFESMDGTEAEWTVVSDYMTVKPEAKSIRTKQKFGDCQLHIEWLTPVVIQMEAREKEIVESILWNATKFRFWTPGKMKLTRTDRLHLFISSISLW